MSKKEEFAEIFDLLKSVAVHRGQPILDSELREITKRVFEYRQGPDLYRLIMGISTAKYFPSGCDLERQVREAKGLKPLKGLTPDLIDKFEEECVASGQSVKNAKAGAEMARKTLRKEPIKAEPKEVTIFGGVKHILDKNAGNENYLLNLSELDNFDKVTTISIDEELDKF